MTLLEREQNLIERYTIIEDHHERLNAIINHRLTSLELSTEERRVELLVHGCSSQVWLEARVVNARLVARYAADSIMVKGLVALFVELYHDSGVADAKDFSPRLLIGLGLEQMLSPTRLHGLAQVIEAFKKAVYVDRCS
jgi:cysteine desulfuration protein SufE